MSSKILRNVRPIAYPDLRGYAASDWDVVDYEMWTADGQIDQLRGPPPAVLTPGSYVVAVGAAQTFGRFCPRPYPSLLAEEFDMPCLNLGLAGAGPRAFLRPAMLELMNDAACVIVQVMSGRSLSNSVFVCPTDGGTLQRRGTNEPPKLALEAWREWMAELEITLGAGTEEWTRKILDLVEESRTLWIESMTQVRRAITRPAILLWFSKRDPDYEIDYSRPELVFGDFPQLVDGPTLAAAASVFDQLVYATTSRGSPQPLFNRFTGEPHFIGPKYPLPHNSYYPSPEMQEDAAAVLLAPVASMLRP